MGKGRDKRRKGKGSECKKEPAEKRRRNDSDDEDLDAVLAEFERSRAEATRVESNVDCPAGPSPRANFSFLPNPSLSGELLVFGGEHYDGDRCRYFGDLIRFNVEKNSWKQVVSRLSPKPRSSHQMVAMSNGQLLLFGGEFGSSRDTKFMHFRDTWQLNPKTFEWSEVGPSGQGGPSPRSGHRMVAWKHYAVLFGGFQDSGAETKYFDDLWTFDGRELAWRKLECKGPRPSPRSGFVFAPHPNGAVLYGGYHVPKVKAKGQTSSGICLTDCWLLKLAVESGGQPSGVWESLRLSGAPSPRSGMSGVVLRHSLFVFGGVEDRETLDEFIHGVCKDELFELNLERPNGFRQVVLEKGGPIGRFNAGMAVLGKEIVVLGGIVECGDEEVFLDDSWALSPGKGPSPAWTLLRQSSIDTASLSWTFSDGGDDSEDDSGSDSDSSRETSDDDSSADSLGSSSDTAREKDDGSGSDNDGLADYPIPSEGQSLRDYFAANSEHFLGAVSTANSDSILSDKQLRSLAFEAAQVFYETHRINKLDL